MRRFFFVLGILVLAALACSSSGEKNTSGGEVVFDEYGFSATFPKDYDVTDMFGLVSVTQKGARIEVGPSFSPNVSDWKGEDDLAWQLDGIRHNNNDLYTYDGTYFPVNFGNESGLAMSFTGYNEENNVQVAGIELVANLSDGRHLDYFGIWPADQQAKYEPVYYEILNSMKFFTPGP